MAVWLVALVACAFLLNTRHNQFAYFYHPDEPGKVEQVIEGKWNFNHPMLLLSTAKVAVELTGTLNYVSGMKVEDSSYNLPDCASALSTIFPNGLPAGGSPLCRVPSFTTFNLNASWQVTSGFSLRASVTNLFDRAAPIDAFASGSTGGGVSSGGAHYNPSLHQEGAVGRYVTVGATYRF